MSLLDPDIKDDKPFVSRDTFLIISEVEKDRKEITDCNPENMKGEVRILGL